MSQHPSRVGHVNPQIGPRISAYGVHRGMATAGNSHLAGQNASANLKHVIGDDIEYG